MKSFGKLLVIVVLLSLLAGCGGGAQPPAATQPPAVEPAITEAPVVATEAPLSAAEQWAQDNAVGQY